MRIETTVRYESDVPDDTDIDEYMANVWRYGPSYSKHIEVTAVSTIRIDFGRKASCPHCGEVIKTVDAEGYLRGELNSNGDIKEIHREWTVFCCPRCGEEIVKDATSTAEVCRALWGNRWVSDNTEKGGKQ